MPDAMEAIRKHMQEKAAQELAGVQRHNLASPVTVLAIVLPPKSNLVIIDLDKTAVGDRNPMRIAGQVSEHLAWPGERPFGIDNPVCTP
jgi:hypothetical protein